MELALATGREMQDKMLAKAFCQFRLLLSLNSLEVISCQRSCGSLSRFQIGDKV
jgi:hypothetical protein